MSKIYKYITVDGDMLDEICYRYYGFTNGSVEKVLEQNPGLIDKGFVYDAGEEIELPDLTGEDKESKEVSFWD